MNKSYKSHFTQILEQQNSERNERRKNIHKLVNIMIDENVPLKDVNNIFDCMGYDFRYRNIQQNGEFITTYQIEFYNDDIIINIVVFNNMQIIEIM